MGRAGDNAARVVFYETGKPLKVLIAGLPAHSDDTVHDLPHAVHGGFRICLSELFLYDVSCAQECIVPNQPVQDLSAVIPRRHGFTQ